MTPMVDLAFLLLTFFVLTMTINKLYVLPVDKPEDDPAATRPAVKQERVLTILLGAEDKIYYFMSNNAPQTTYYNVSGIRKVILESKQQRADLVVLIKPMATSRYQNLVDIMDELSQAKLTNYYLVKPTREEQSLVASLK